MKEDLRLDDYLSECPEMLRLREALDDRGIERADDSDVLTFDSGIKQVMLRTSWMKGDDNVSVIWGYLEYMSHSFGCLMTTGISYGYPDGLECWYLPNDKEPVPMTAEEIVEVCA